MTQTPLNIAAQRPGMLAAAARWRAVYLELAKARLSAMVVVTTAVGFVLGSGGAIDGWKLLLTLIGTALTAGAANALNQIIERRRDALMVRTRNRPLPSGRMGPHHAGIVAMVMAMTGLALMCSTVNPLSSALAAATLVIYVAMYTPSKTRTTANTLIGAVVGAIPPMIGWAAATGTIEPGAWLLAALLFVWQVPHFLALAWLYRDDYALGGYRMLPIVDPTGAITARTALLWTAALLPVGVVGMMLDVTGWLTLAASLALGAWMLGRAIDLAQRRDAAAARRLFLASLVYLPLVLVSMVLDLTVAAILP